MRDCIDEGTLQTWFDGELNTDEALSVTAHLSVCGRCAESARTLEGENLLVATAMAAQFTETVPSERLRQRLDARIAGLHHETAPEVSESRWRAITSLFAFRPLAYASVAAVILLATFVGVVYLKKEKANLPEKEARVQNPSDLPQPSPEPTIVPVDNQANPSYSPRVPRRAKRPASTPRTNEPSFVKQEREYQTTIARLNDTFQSKPALRPSLRVEYEYNLALIDNAITATRDVARKNPKDPHAAQFVLSAYQSKVDLMNQFDELRGLEK